MQVSSRDSWQFFRTFAIWFKHCWLPEWAEIVLPDMRGSLAAGSSDHGHVSELAVVCCCGSWYYLPSDVHMSTYSSLSMSPAFFGWSTTNPKG